MGAGNPLLTKLARLRAALRTDRVLSGAQLERHFDLSPSQLQPLKDFTQFSATLQPVYRSVRSRTVVPFVTLEASMERRLSAEQVGHLAGTAEIRLQLAAAPQDWQSGAAALGRSNKPDAVYLLGEHRVAIEYDAGSYRARVIEQKLEQFSRDYAGLVWGVTSGVRARRLQDRLGAHGVQVLHLNWWSDQG
ncbi:hypothetical protein GO986_12325 [Deinococcus sp. HMF7620]|uniref:Uncharacterized protein n=1 Tax=Deinococcus arboris TaxID=2682977 RepID=A0A7C9HS86_9DEIO|nr:MULTISPECIES: replication-relaxation family protein [Deinococcus]MBZ9752194.1 replication-relaxation family protein [Deinococcus betulae]MVN87552.1 hypothetical protein [Deinococcus arboris]